MAPCEAQDTPRLKIPCAQVARMGLAKFQQRFSAVTHDDSTAGMIAACDQYCRCRRQVNDVHTRALPTQRRQQVRQIRGALDALAEAGNSHAYIESGGGTIWGPITADARAEREDFLATLIADLGRPPVSSHTVRRGTEARLGSAHKMLASLASPKWPDPAAAESSSLKDYKRTYASARTALARLEILMRTLPDVPAIHVAREVTHVLTTPSEN